MQITLTTTSFLFPVTRTAKLSLTKAPLETHENKKAQVASDFLLFETEDNKQIVYDVRTHTAVKNKKYLELKDRRKRVAAKVEFGDEKDLIKCLAEINFAKESAAPIDKAKLKHAKLGRTSAPKKKKDAEEQPPIEPVTTIVPPVKQQSDMPKISTTPSDEPKVDEQTKADDIPETTVLPNSDSDDNMTEQATVSRQEDKKADTDAGKLVAAEDNKEVADDAQISATNIDVDTVGGTASVEMCTPVAISSWHGFFAKWRCTSQSVATDAYITPITEPELVKSPTDEEKEIAAEIIETFAEMEKETAAAEIHDWADREGDIIFIKRMLAKNGFLLPMSMREVSIVSPNILKYGDSEFKITAQTTCYQSTSLKAYVVDIVSGKNKIRLGAADKDSIDELIHVIEKCVYNIKTHRFIDGWVERQLQKESNE